MTRCIPSKPNYVACPHYAELDERILNCLSVLPVEPKGNSFCQSWGDGYHNKCPKLDRCRARWLLEEQ